MNENKLSDWGTRAEANFQALFLALVLHKELQENIPDSDKKPLEVKLTLYVSNEKVLDTTEPIRIKGIAKKSMTLYVEQETISRITASSIPLGDVMMITYPNRQLQLAILNKLEADFLKY